MIFTTDSAKQFLLSKLKERAGQDRVALDDIEQRMFLFSESSGTPDLEAQEKFDRDYDTDAYEAKVTKLLRESYAHDKHIAEASHEWAEALKALGEEDFYGLVMVDQAKILRQSQAPRVGSGFWTSTLEMLPLRCHRTRSDRHCLVCGVSPAWDCVTAAGLVATDSAPGVLLADLVRRQSIRAGGTVETRLTTPTNGRG